VLAGWGLSQEDAQAAESWSRRGLTREEVRSIRVLVVPGLFARSRREPWRLLSGKACTISSDCSWESLFPVQKNVRAAAPKGFDLVLDAEEKSESPVCGQFAGQAERAF